MDLIKMFKSFFFSNKNYNGFKDTKIREIFGFMKTNYLKILKKCLK